MEIDSPLVSICMPTYNNQDFIRETIQSILNQTFTNWELQISDDCSTDLTLQHIESFCDSRIKIHRSPKRLGLGNNWNRALSLAQGEYVKFMCADDLIDPTCLSLQVEAILKDDRIELVNCYTSVINEKGKVVFNRQFPFFRGRVSRRRAIRSNYWFGTNLIGEPMVGLFRTKSISDCSFDGTNPYLIDLDFWFQILSKGDLYTVPETLASFRISKNSLSSTLTEKQAEWFSIFAKKYYKKKVYEIHWLEYKWSIIASVIIQKIRELTYKFQFN